MIVDLKNGTVDVTVIFEQPQTARQKELLDYILDQISEMEYDYHEDPN